MKAFYVSLNFLLVTKLLYKLKCPYVCPHVCLKHFGENVIFSVPIKDGSLKLFDNIFIIKEHN